MINKLWKIKQRRGPGGPRSRVAVAHGKIHRMVREGLAEKEMRTKGMLGKVFQQDETSANVGV